MIGLPLGTTEAVNTVYEKNPMADMMKDGRCSFLESECKNN
jgi:hypothetical protein